MFFDRGHGTIARLLLCTALVATLACGNKGDPQPPPRKNPARTTDLTVAQRGGELVVSMSYPAMTSGGLALVAIDKVELWQYTRPAPELMEMPEELMEIPEGGAEAADGAEEPAIEEAVEEPLEEVVEETVGQPAGAGETGTETTSGAEAEESTEETEDLVIEEPDPFLRIMIDPKEFDKHSQSILALEESDLEAAIVGGRIVMRIALEEISTEPPTAYAFAVRTSAGRLRSEKSSPTAFAPRPAPAPLTDLELSPSSSGVSLTWSVPEDETDIEGYHVYRRLAASPEFDKPLIMVTPGVGEHDDRSARFGNRYVYSIAAVRVLRPLVESMLSGEQTVNHLDVFPPPAPTGLVSLAEVGRVRLLWNAGRGRDTVGYLVFARRGEGETEQLTAEPITASEFVHEGASSGVTYVYTVLAIDSAGNQSDPSEAATTRVP